MRDWLVHIRRNEHASLQTQIREALVSGILDGQLAHDEPIPSTRKMAKNLGVSRNTVVLAYQGMLDDGYLVARERSGYYVSDKALEAPAITKPRKPARSASGAQGNVGWEERILKHPAAQENISKRLTGSPMPTRSSMARLTTIFFPLPSGENARAKRWGGNGSAPGRMISGPSTIPCL